MLSTLLASAAVLPCPTINSMALNFFMICSGVCRFFFISSLPTLRVADSHNIWFLFRGALQDEVGEEAQGQCRALGRATPSLRPSIDLLYDIEQIINPSRLTKALDQFG